MKKERIKSKKILASSNPTRAGKRGISQENKLIA